MNLATSDDAPTPPAVTAIILAAGASSRMGHAHKLLETIGDKSIVRRVAETALASRATDVIVVAGYRADEVTEVLPGDLTVVRNEDFGSGLASSLRCGVRALSEEVDAALIMLGDMPFVTADECDALIDAFDTGRICVPVTGGRRGNPVLWDREFFGEMSSLSGDRGARALMARHSNAVVEVPVVGGAVLIDIDVPDDLEQARERG